MNLALVFQKRRSGTDRRIRDYDRDEHHLLGGILMQVIKRISTKSANRTASEAIWSSDSIASAESQAKKTMRRSAS